MQEPSLGNHQPDEGERDRVEHLVGVVGQKRDLEHHSRDGGLHVLPAFAQEDAPPLLVPGAGDGSEEQGVETEGEGGQDGRRPDRWMSRQPGPGEGEEGDRGRGDQAAAKIIEDLPARDQRQPVALQAFTGGHDGKEPEEDLPVAPHPPMLSPGVGEHARRIVVHHFDVRHQRGAGVETLEQVVREQGVFGHPPVQRGHKRVHVVEAFARKQSFTEEVLVGIRHGGGIGVDPGVARVHPGES